MSLLRAERETYADIWNGLPAYGRHAPGEQYLPVFLSLVGDQRGSLLDAGTGSGKAAVQLSQAGFDVTCCDLTPDGLIPDAKRLPFVSACLWHDLYPIARGKGHPNRTRFDFVYCCDVLEHVPPQFTMLVIDQLLRVTARGLFLSVSLVPDSFGVWAGKSLHQTVQPFAWWKENLAELGRIADARDLIGNALFYVNPKGSPDVAGVPA